MDSMLPPGAIPADQFQPADAAPQPQGLPEGSIPADQFESAEDAYGTTGQQLKTAAEGAAEGVLGPAAPWIEKNILKEPKADILGRAEENPISKAAGQTAGLVGSSMIGTGEGALLDEAGQAAVKATGLLSKGAEASTAAKIGAGAVKSAVETGLFQGGDETSKMILDDPHATAQSAVADVGLAAALGGVTGAALGSINPLWKATFGDRVAPVIEDMKARYKFRAENPDIQSAGLEELQGKLDAVSDLKDKLWSGHEDAAGGLKAEAIRGALPEDLAPISEQNQKLYDQFNDTLKKMKSDTYKYPERLTNKLEEDMNNWQGKVTHPDANPEAIFNATQELKQTLQSYSKFNKAIPSTAPEYDFVQATKNLGRDLRLSLEEPEVWGKAADVQKNINKAVSDYIPAEKDFLAKFTSKVGGEKAIDPGKFQTYFNSIGKARGELKQEMLGNFLDRHEQLINAVNKAFTDQGLESQVDHTASSILRDTIGEKTTGTQLMDTLIDHALDNVVGKGIGATIGGVLGHAVGAPVIGALAGEKLLGKQAGSVVQGLSKRLLANKTSTNGIKSAIDYATAAAKGENALGNAVKNVFRTGIAASMPSVIDREKLDKVVEHMTDQPSRMMAINNGHLGHYMPEHQTALSETNTRALQYLQNIKPRPYRLSPLDKEIQPTQVQQERYNRALDIAQDPKLVLQKAKDGTLLPSDVGDLNSMYPDLYRRMAGKVSAEIQNRVSNEDTIPYKSRIGVSLLLGQALDSTMQPSSIIAAQPKPQNKPQAPQQATPKRGAASKLGKTNSSYMTPNQSAESDRTKGRSE